MPHSRRISKRAGIQALKLITVCALLPLFLNASCPTWEPPFPPRLGSPVITNIEITEVLRSGFYYPNIHIAWKPPEIDSVPVRYYRVLELGPDTAFSIVSLNIPGTLTDYYQKLDKADFPPVTSLDVRIFKVIAIDSLARAGDSSESCTLYIAPQVYKDTMTNDGCLSWVMQAQMGQMQTWASVWNMNHDIIWTGDITEEFAAELHGFNIRSCMTAVPADTGMYFYGIRFVLNLSHVSLKIGSFNVP